MCSYIPKFHFELNPIELVVTCARQKLYTYILNDMKKLILLYQYSIFSDGRPDENDL